jgi:hypothetical protein
LLGAKSPNLTEKRIGEHLKGLEGFSIVQQIKEFFSDNFTTIPYSPKDWSKVEVPDFSKVDTKILSMIQIEKAKAEGFKFEFGRKDIVYPNKRAIEEPERDCQHFQEHFLKNGDGNHIHYVSDGSEDVSIGPVVLTLESPAEKERKAILRLKRGNERFIIPPEHSITRKEMLKYVKLTFPDIARIKLTKLSDTELDRRLEELDRKSVSNKYKFGVLYVKEGQIDENDMFSNVSGSKDYEEFLSFIGDKIVLQGWNQYRGGLDVKNNTTGTHSIYYKYKNYEIMYHVSTLLPFQPEDKQRVERKRHLGNDIVVIIFKEGDQPFDPLCLTTHFNHIFCVISRDTTRNDGIYYKIAIANKSGVPPYGPFLKENPVYERNEDFKDFLLTKCNVSKVEFLTI